MPELTRGALVTGATGPIGRALVRAFAGAGYFVGVHFHRDESGARSPRERGQGLPADQDLSIVDESEIGEGGGLDEAEMARVMPLDGRTDEEEDEEDEEEER